MFYLTGIIITFFLVFLLLGKKNKSRADYILASWLFFIGIHLALFYLRFIEKNFEYPQLLGLEIPLPLIHGPFLYLYTATLTGIRPKWSALHFFPALIAYIFLIPFFRLPASEKVSVYLGSGAGFETFILVNFISIIISGIFYVATSLVLLRRHQRNIINQFSDTERINLRWLQYLVIGISVIWLVVIVGRDEHVYSTVVLFVLFIGFFGIRQAGIFTTIYQSPVIPVINGKGIDDSDTPGVSHFLSAVPAPTRISDESGNEPGSENPRNKYAKSGLNESEAELIHQQLSQIMETEKLFRNSEITLVDLSQKLNVHPNILSQVINSREQKNFYDYINSRRIEEFKNRVISPESQKFTLLSLAYECGFNSKTSFNRNFKKATGTSPSEYLNRSNVTLA